MVVLPMKALSDSSREPLADPPITLLCNINTTLSNSTPIVTSCSMCVYVHVYIYIYIYIYIYKINKSGREFL